MIVEITPEFWALLGLIVILYGLGALFAGYYTGKSIERKRAKRYIEKLKKQLNSQK